MSSDLNQYGQFYGGNSFVTSGRDICEEQRLYPNNAYYRFNKLRDYTEYKLGAKGL